MTSTMTCEQFETVLPQLLDDETGGAALTPIVRGHIERCGACRSLFNDLNVIRAQAADLPQLSPSRDLWSGIASRIEAPVVPLVEGVTTRVPRRQLSWRSAGVAAALLVAVNLVVTWKLVRRNAPVTTLSSIGTEADPSVGTTPDTANTLSGLAEKPALPVPSYESTAIMASRPRGTSFVLATNEPQQPKHRESPKLVYDREITRLRAIVDSGRAKLNPATVALLDRNLRVLDQAIDQYNDALARDPSSAFLVESLNNAYQTKVKLLRIAAAVAKRG